MPCVRASWAKKGTDHPGSHRSFTVVLAQACIPDHPAAKLGTPRFWKLTLRYALYFSPAESHPLTNAAARWLGRDAFTAETFPTPQVEDLSAETVARLTSDPRRYGFHATIKAPFELQPDRNEAELISAVEDFANQTPAFDIPKVVVGQLDRFFAIVPDQVYPDLQRFAASVVETFEPFRAPLSEADIARRRPERLTASERDNLDRWGYPHVMDDFQFHMTLTGQVEPDLAPAMRRALDQRFEEFTAAPLSIDGLALFIEPSRGDAFTIHRWLPLAPNSHKRKTDP
jgi:putative phosphonate metabolism protein